ncbi:MAG: MerR family transcriptional regulator [Microscillaceae bacterium]|nr:MerR family transcriptional regulator [Microscillaceae bacterium]MDW8460540.1 MerR family transcriptional regulator [Cytophagales bacterium]
MGYYSIKDLEHLSGIKAHTLRIWEQRYNLVKPRRTDSNIRYYDDYDLKLILNVSLLKDYGYKISTIAKMSEQEMREAIIKVTEKSQKYFEHIQALTIAMIDLDEARFEKIIATNVLQMGFEKTMIHIIYPFLVKIGFLWQTGSISPSQEHFITNLIRQKLIVAIDGQTSQYKSDAKTYMLYLPEGELHELGLLFANYLIRARGNRVIYLGQTLPLNDLQEAYKIHTPDYILTIITSSPTQDRIQEYVDSLAQLFPQAIILLGGYQIVGQDIRIAKNMMIIKKIEDLIEFIETNEIKEED